MDLLAKAVKSGIAKGYTVGQQQLQQHLAKQRNSSGQPGQDNNAGSYYGTQGSPLAYSSPYPSTPQQQQQQQQQQQHYTAPVSYNAGQPPPLPPRQYQSYHAPAAPAPYDSSYTQVNHETSTGSRPDSSYSSILPPPPPSYIPPPSAADAPIQMQNAAAPQHFNSQTESTYRDNGYHNSTDYNQNSLHNAVPDSYPPTPLTPSATDSSRRQQEASLQYDAQSDTYRLVEHNSSTSEYSRPPVMQQQPLLAPVPVAMPPRDGSNDSQTYPGLQHEQPPPIPPKIAPESLYQSPGVNGGYERSPVLPTSLEQQMDSLNLNAAPTELPASQPAVSPKPKKKGAFPPMKADGPGREVAWFCPEDRLVDYQLYWYYLADLPDSPICTRCHADHIESTSMASKFTRALAEPDSALSCHFRYPRVQNVLWKAALKTSDLQDLKSFLSRRLQIPNCKGRVATRGDDGIKYYGMKGDEIHGFIACEACYEDRIVGTAFESRFDVYEPKQGKNDQWMCDMSVLYIQKAFPQMAEKNNWPGFVEGATRRFKLAACEGKELAREDSGNWFTTRQKMKNFQVCETCYMDRVETGTFRSDFEQMPNAGQDFDLYMVFLRQRWCCSLPSNNLPMMFALDSAEDADDFAVFQKAAAAILPLVPCTANGIIRGNWWTLAGGCENFDICEACYEGVMKTNGLDRFLEPNKTRGAEGDTIVCDFCPAAPRYAEYLSKLAEALDRGIFSCYANHVRDFAAVPACPGRDHLERGRWWGYGEALFCENCYLSFVRHTPLGGHTPLKGEHDERAQICQIWSPRMRAMWRAACDAGSPGSPASEAAVLEFRAFGSRRLEVYLQTVPQIRFIRTMKDIRMMQAMQQGQLSLLYKGMNSMAVLSGTGDGYAHGNSSLGWYETEHGATGAQMFNNMQAGMADATRGDEWMQMMQLELMWSQVE